MRTFTAGLLAFATAPMAPSKSRVEIHRAPGRQKHVAGNFLSGVCSAEKIPLFILTAVVSAITYIAQQRGGVVVGLETIPLSYRAANAVISYVVYIEKMIWPSGLAAFYPYSRSYFSMGWIVASVVLLVAISVCCVYFFHSRKYLITGWLWYLGVFVPVIGLVQAGAQARADRYMYVPMVGLLIIVAWGAGELFAKWRCRRVVPALLGVVIISAAMVCASLQLRHWQNSMHIIHAYARCNSR